MNRKIEVGTVIEGVVETYRDNAAVLLPVAAVVFLIEAVASALLLGAAFFLFPLAYAVLIAAVALYAGMVVSLVSDVQDGRRDSSVEQLLKSVTPVLLPLIGAGILAGLGIGFGFLLLIVPGLFLLTIWAVFAPAIVVERAGILQSLGRSRELVRGNGWQVFGVLVIVYLVSVVVQLLLAGIGAAIADLVGRLIFDFIGSVLTAPLAALAAAILYFNLRAAKGEASPPGGQLDATGAHAQVGGPSSGGEPASTGTPAERQQPPDAPPPQQGQPSRQDEPPR